MGRRWRFFLFENRGFTMRCFEKFVLTVVKMIFSSVEGKRTRTGRNLKEFFFLIETVIKVAAVFGNLF